MYQKLASKGSMVLVIQVLLYVGTSLLISNPTEHGLRAPGEEIAFTAWPKINSHSQIFR